MGTRVVYTIMTAGLSYPAVTLFANWSHPEIDVDEVFKGAIDNAQGATDLAERLLSMRYETAGGNHRAGDRVFAIVEGPFGDYDYQYRLAWNGLVQRMENTAQPVRIPASVLLTQGKDFDPEEVSETMGHHDLSDQVWDALPPAVQAAMIDANCG